MELTNIVVVFFRCGFYGTSQEKRYTHEYYKRIKHISGAGSNSLLYLGRRDNFFVYERLLRFLSIYMIGARSLFLRLPTQKIVILLLIIRILETMSHIWIINSVPHLLQYAFFSITNMCVKFEKQNHKFSVEKSSCHYMIDVHQQAGYVLDSYFCIFAIRSNDMHEKYHCSLLIFAKFEQYSGPLVQKIRCSYNQKSLWYLEFSLVVVPFSKSGLIVKSYQWARNICVCISFEQFANMQKYLCICFNFYKV